MLTVASQGPTEAAVPAGLCDVDLGRDGKQFGHLRFPHSSNESAWGSVMVPVVVVRNGAGPTALLCAGSHGDEYEGQVALRNLARELAPQDISGRVIILPMLNAPAAIAGTRLSPIDGRNMNRVFPGSASGTLTERIAHFVDTVLVEAADVVVDLHSGGVSLEFLPSVIAHRLPDERQMATTLGYLEAFGAPTAVLLSELEPEGMLDTAVEERGKVFLSTELGGAGQLSPDALGIGARGVRNVLAHAGILRRPRAASPAPTFLDVPTDDSYVGAPVGGLYEPFLPLGAKVTADAPVGQVHVMDDVQRAPVLVTSPHEGVVLCQRSRVPTTQGDCLAVVAVVSS